MGPSVKTGLEIQEQRINKINFCIFKFMFQIYFRMLLHKPFFTNKHVGFQM